MLKGNYKAVFIYVVKYVVIFINRNAFNDVFPFGNFDSNIWGTILVASYPRFISLPRSPYCQLTRMFIYGTPTLYHLLYCATMYLVLHYFELHVST